MKPEPMSSDMKYDIAVEVSRSDDLVDVMRGIDAGIAARDKQWEEMLSKQEPVAWLDAPAEMAYSKYELMGEDKEGLLPLYTHPAPQQTNQFDLMVITTAYEQGVGKGIKRDNFNPYEAGTDAHSAWALGYEEGASKPAPQQEKPHPDIVFGDPL